MRRTNSSPVKVYDTTRDQLRITSAVMTKSQAEILETAMNEYVARHNEEILLGLKRAREALASGSDEAVAYLIDETPEAVRRVWGESPTQLVGKSESPRTNEPLG